MPLKTKDDYFDKVFEEYKEEFTKAIELEIQLGNGLAVESANQFGKKTKINPLNVSKKDLDLYTEKVFLNIKDANRDISKRITNIVLDNISSNGSNSDLSKSLKKKIRGQCKDN